MSRGLLAWLNVAENGKGGDVVARNRTRGGSKADGGTDEEGIALHALVGSHDSLVLRYQVSEQVSI